MVTVLQLEWQVCLMAAASVIWIRAAFGLLWYIYKFPVYFLQKICWCTMEPENLSFLLTGEQISAYPHQNIRIACWKIQDKIGDSVNIYRIRGSGIIRKEEETFFNLVNMIPHHCNGKMDVNGSSILWKHCMILVKMPLLWKIGVYYDLHSYTTESSNSYKKYFIPNVTTAELTSQTTNASYILAWKHFCVYVMYFVFKSYGLEMKF